MVYRAEDARTNRLVALKLLAGSLFSTDSIGTAENGEAAFRDLDHSGIVRVLDSGAIAGVGARVARALAHARDRRVFHRDVKPSNVLIDREGRALLTDFGVARRSDRPDPTTTTTINRPGTYRYMAPELFS